MSRLTIDVTEQQHQNLKAMAALQGKSIKEYALERLFPSAVDEAQALAELRALLDQRIAQSQRGEVIDRSLSDIANDPLSADARA